MVAAFIAFSAALSGCGSYQAQLKQDLAAKVTAGNTEDTAFYPVTPDQLVEVADFTIGNNGYNTLKRDVTPEGTYIVGRTTMKIIGMAVVTPMGVVVRDEGAKGASVTAISRSKHDTAQDMLAWIAESFKTKDKYAAWLKAGTRAATAAAAVKPAVDAKPREQINIAVADFTADGVSPSDASVIANLLRGELVKTGAFSMVEKSRMDAILQEQAFQAAACTDNECAVKLGKLLSVRKMVLGSFGKLMGDYFVNVRVVDVETGKVVTADDVKGTSSSEIQQGIKALAARFAAQGI
jgi:hypothetical protein